jgi:hypothetical protein
MAAGEDDEAGTGATRPCTTLWASDRDTVDGTHRAVDSGRPSLTGAWPAVDDGIHRWTPGPGLTSVNGMSSTIHSPYYRHCQN